MEISFEIPTALTRLWHKSGISPLGTGLFLIILTNVCVSSVVRFRSRALSPTQNVERRYKLWITPHRTIEETFCCGQCASTDILFGLVSSPPLIYWRELAPLTYACEEKSTGLSLLNSTKMCEKPSFRLIKSNCQFSGELSTRSYIVIDSTLYWELSLRYFLSIVK